MVEEFCQLFYKSRKEVAPDSDSEPDVLTFKKGIVNQGSELLPDITLGEVELVLRKTKNNKAHGDDNGVADAIKIGGPCLLEKIRALFDLCLHNTKAQYQMNGTTP